MLPIARYHLGPAQPQRAGSVLAARIQRATRAMSGPASCAGMGDPTGCVSADRACRLHTFRGEDPARDRERRGPSDRAASAHGQCTGTLLGSVLLGSTESAATGET